jgi:hypothetical protein
MRVRREPERRRRHVLSARAIAWPTTQPDDHAH